MKIIKNDEAVSPVIGVILMVAITVILAAVIAAFVFGMAGTTTTTKTVGITVSINKTDNATMHLQFTGGADLSALSSFVVNYDGAEATPDDAYTADSTPKVELSGNKIQPTTAAATFSVGEVVIIELPNVLTGHKVTVIGTFTDGASQILLDRTL